MTEAVVYIPDDIEDDEALLARRGVVHIERRGYRFVGVLRKWKHVLAAAADGAVVVFARQEHAAAVSRWRVDREFVGEVTCRLVPIVQEAAAHRLNSPSDESPTVAFLDRFRRNGRIPAPDDGGFAERFLKERSRRS